MEKVITFLQTIITSTTVGVLIFLLTKNNHFSCPALEVFNNKSSIDLMIATIKLLATIIVVWFLGLISFLVIRKKKKINIYVYFAIVTTIAFTPLIYKAFIRIPEKNRLIKEEICQKGNDDGMQLILKQLTKNEYNLINSETNWLPVIPNETKNINIDYYRDSFIGDFHLIIELKLNDNETIDLKQYPRMNII